MATREVIREGKHRFLHSLVLEKQSLRGCEGIISGGCKEVDSTKHEKPKRVKPHGEVTTPGVRVQHKKSVRDVTGALEGPRSQSGQAGGFVAGASLISWPPRWGAHILFVGLLKEKQNMKLEISNTVAEAYPSVTVSEANRT